MWKIGFDRGDQVAFHRVLELLAHVLSRITGIPQV
jgi:hypothetical protein